MPLNKGDPKLGRSPADEGGVKLDRGREPPVSGVDAPGLEREPLTDGDKNVKCEA
jgi:hypothetical protein